MNKKFEKLGFYPADILLPKDQDMRKWAVVACDQFTSEPEYWQAVEQTVGDAPSTLRLILPEANLKAPNVDEYIADINASMDKYLAGGVFQVLPESLVYIERQQSDGRIRHGLIGMVDLDAYDFTPGSGALIRATEGTVLDRIPPRARVRRNAPIELPHVMLLIDDPEKTVIEPLTAASGEMDKLYDFDLMQNGGHIRGYKLTDRQVNAVADALEGLTTDEAMQKKYGVSGVAPLLFAVGDGNHSLATAKACWEQIKPTLSEAERENHPARFALCELVNLHSPALVFRPVHRVVFGADIDALQSGFELYLRAHGMTLTDGGEVTLVQGGERRGFAISGRGDRLPVDVLQKYLDQACGEKSGWSLDYVHGDADAASLAQNGATAALLGAMDKRALFPAIAAGGVLPRKTFSMGEATEKRYYMECRAIEKNNEKEMAAKE